MGKLDGFFKKFGNVTEEYSFYNGEVILRYDVKKHQYLLVKDGELIPQTGVTTAVHIIDKSEVLMNWSVKVMAAKLLLTTPSFEIPSGEKFVPQMTWERYEKLVLEAKKAKDEHLETAGGIGHEAHDWIEKFIKATLAGNEGRRLELLANFPEDDRARNACLAALEWMSKHNVRWKSTEQKVYSRAYKYAGTMDGLALVDSCDDPACCPNDFANRLTVVDWKTSNYLYLEYLLQTAAYQQAFNEMSGYDSNYTSPIATDRWVIRLGKDDAEFDPWHMGAEDFVQDFECFKTALGLGNQVDAVTARIKERENAKRDVKRQAKNAAKAVKDAAKALEKAEAQEKRHKERLEAREAKALAKKKAQEEKKAARAALKALKPEKVKKPEPKVPNTEGIKSLLAIINGQKDLTNG